MTPIKKPVGEAKAHFHELLRLVELEGQEIILTRHGKECVRISPVLKKKRKKLMGFLKSQIHYKKDESFDIKSEEWGELDADGRKIKFGK